MFRYYKDTSVGVPVALSQSVSDDSAKITEQAAFFNTSSSCVPLLSSQFGDKHYFYYYLLLLLLSIDRMAAAWEDRVAPVRAKREASLAKVEPALKTLPTDLPLNSQALPRELLTPREIEITEDYTVKQLLAKLKSREISSEEVTRAFLRRAAVAQAAVRHTHSQPPHTHVNSV